MHDQFIEHNLPTRSVLPVQRQRRSNVLMLPMVVIGGAMGLLAGYGALSLMGEKGIGPLKKTDATDTAQSPSIKKPMLAEQPRPVNPPLTTYKDPPVIRPSRPIPRTVPKEQVSIVPAKQIPKPVAARIAPIAPKPEARAEINKPSAIVTLALDKPIVRVMAETDKASAAVCDVSFSQNLLHRNENVSGYELVAENLGHRDKRTIELGAQIVGAGAAIEITVTRRNNVIICELRPLFSLPSGDIQPLTITRGTKMYNELSRSLDAAKSARQTLPEMRSSLSRLQSDLRLAQQAMNGNGNTPGETGAGRTQATIRATTLNRQISTMSKNVATAERLLAEEPSNATDMRSLDDIAQYAKTIASVSTVSVRFHWGETTIPATVK